MDGICGICGKATDETMLTVDDHETVCLECATKMAKEAQVEKRYIEIYDEHWNNWLTSATFAITALWRFIHEAKV